MGLGNMGDAALTMAEVQSAQQGDATATEAVLRAMDGRIQSIAVSEARRCLGDAQTLAEEFAQSARIAVWEALPRFSGESVDEFFAFMHSTALAVVRDSAGEERNPGADRDALKIFKYWVQRCDGDPFLAEKMCQTVPPQGGRRLGRDRAHAARLAWQPTLEIDAPHKAADREHDATSTIAEVLSSSWGVPEELITAGDLSAEDTRQRVAAVRAILDVMGQQTANVLRGSFGIAPMSLFNFARGDNGDAELAEALGMTEKQVKTGRSKGYKSFAERWVPFVSKGDSDIASEWWEAYQAERNRWRRTAEA